MPWVQIIPAALVAAALHALALRIVTALMVEVPVKYSLALKIVAIEYAAVLVLAGGLAGLHLGSQTVVIVGGSLAYLFVGAACIGLWITFGDGKRLGVGNGVLIQAIQIPLIIPVVIVGSFLL